MLKQVISARILNPSVYTHELKCNINFLFSSRQTIILGLKFINNLSIKLIYYESFKNKFEVNLLINKYRTW